jgi:hypothetical protein
VYNGVYVDLREIGYEVVNKFYSAQDRIRKGSEVDMAVN